MTVHITPWSLCLARIGSRRERIVSGDYCDSYSCESQQECAPADVAAVGQEAIELA